MLFNLYKTIVSLMLWPIWFIYLIISLPILLIYIFLFDKKYYHYMIRLVSYLFCFFGGQLVKVSGEIPNPKDGPYLYLINHQSLFDHFVIGSCLKHYVSAVAKEEQFKYPLWGHVAKSYGIVPINRSNINKAISSLKNVEYEILKNEISFLIAPEGTRTVDGNLKEFKKGAFHVAKNTSVKIVPVIIKGSYKAKNKSDWRITPGVIKIHFSEIIYKDIYLDMDVEQLKSYVTNRFKKYLG